MLIHDAFSVDGLVTVVTGASSGLGERFTRVLAANGAHVVAVARRLDRLNALAAECPTVVPFAADLADEPQRAAVIDAVIERFGRIDVLVNNAGYGSPQSALDEPIADFRAVLEVNLVALFELSRLAAPHMIQHGSGSIINIASILGQVASTPLKNGSYSASKGAVINLTRELGCQWARSGMRVNAIAPGFFPSEANGELDPNDGGLGEFVRKNTPMARAGRDDELDGALLFLASGASSYCTGQTLTIDGGWTAK